MTLEISLTIAIFFIAVILLVTNRLRSDLIALMVLLALGLTGIVETPQVFSGFSSAAVMTILGISMISVGLEQTGATNAIGKLIHRIGGQNEIILILMVTMTSSILSLFMNNIAVVGVLLPAIMSLARRVRISPSRLLIPLAFGTILGGMATMLTTSNIIVSGAMRDSGIKPFGMLDYLPVGGLVAVAGIIYLSTLGRKLLPVHRGEEQGSIQRDFSDRLTELYQINSTLSRITFLPDSPLINKTIQQGQWQNKLKVNILAVLRQKNSIFAPEPETNLLGDDVIITRGKVPVGLEETYCLKVEPVSDAPVKVSNEARPLAEMLISPHSRLIGKTLSEIRFRDQFSLNVVGFWRGGNPLHAGYAQLPLQFGDALLVQGDAAQIHSLQKNPDLVLLEEDPDAVLMPRKGVVTILITLTVLTVAALGLLPVSLAALGGAILLILTGSMNTNDAFHAIEWKTIFLIAGLWPLSIAFQETGLASLAIDSLVGWVGSLSPFVMTIIFLLGSTLLTLVISGQVSALIMIPLALQAASTLQISPQPLAMAVAMGASMAYLTPFGHPVNLIVMNPGGYTFRDYVRVGGPLTIMSIILVLLGIHWFWGL